MNIVFLDAKTLGNDISLDKFNELGKVTIYQTTNPKETQKRVEDADIIVTNKVVIDKETIENSNIKLICIAATGMNNIDLEAAKNRNITVKNVSGYSVASVVQLTFSFVFYFMQNLSFYKKYVDDGNWEKSDIFTNLDKPFYELENKKWGIIGLGNIGKRVATIAKSFGCNVSYYSTSGTNKNSDFNMLQLDELLKNSDIITIHAPLNDKTLNLLNKTNLSMIRDGAILLNLGRGGIINEEDLVEVLNSDKKLYCGLDVLNIEPMTSDCILKNIRNKEQILITPHIAWASVESRNRLIDLVYYNIKEYIL